MIPREIETVGGSGGSEAQTIIRTFSAPSSLSPHPRRLGVDTVQLCREPRAKNVKNKPKVNADPTGHDAPWEFQDAPSRLKPPLRAAGAPKTIEKVVEKEVSSRVEALKRKEVPAPVGVVRSGGIRAHPPSGRGAAPLGGVRSRPVEPEKKSVRQ